MHQYINGGLIRYFKTYKTSKAHNQFMKVMKPMKIIVVKKLVLDHSSKVI